MFSRKLILWSILGASLAIPVGLLFEWIGGFNAMTNAALFIHGNDLCCDGSIAMHVNDFITGYRFLLPVVLTQLSLVLAIIFLLFDSHLRLWVRAVWLFSFYVFAAISVPIYCVTRLWQLRHIALRQSTDATGA